MNRFLYIKIVFVTLTLLLLPVAVSTAGDNYFASKTLESTDVFESLDIDGNREIDALTDGLLVLRHMFGLTGNSLISGVIGANAEHSSAEEIQTRISNLGFSVDIDNNGDVDALTDGLIILRYLFGLRGDVLVAGVVSSTGQRVDVVDIESHLLGLATLSDDRVDSAWDGTIIKDGTYSPAFDKHTIVHSIVVAAFPDVTDGFLTNVTNILDRMLQKDAKTDDTRRDLLLDNFSRNKFLQRVGSVGPENYTNPSLDDLLNSVNQDNYEAVDFIWELELNEELNEKTQVQRNAQQINEIVEHLLHTVTNGFNKTFNSWDYQNQSSALNLAMAEAIDGNYYDVQSYEEIRDNGDLEIYKHIIAQEFIYWVILTGWDLKTPYKPNTAPEWYVENSEELQTKLPLAYKLFIDEVNGVLVNPTKEYLDGLTFLSIEPQAEAI